MYIRIPWKAQHERRIYNEKAQCSASRGISLASDLLIPSNDWPKIPTFIQLSQAFKTLHRSFQSSCPFTERIDPDNIVMVNGVTANQQFVFREIE
jgi:hypothetical protein